VLSGARRAAGVIRTAVFAPLTMRLYRGQGLSYVRNLGSVSLLYAVPSP
jgi:hypothetical protein